ncbi:MAG: hypothetical protein BGO41_00930 [Clostridiales bacterium 38-18]|nr:MAG: hypothetical protein BGO41_00930 [Clostridiales bacterium 38-18]
MNYKELKIKKSYISYGENDIVRALIIPALKYTKIYRRSIGFFSSSVFESILDGVSQLVKNRGKIEIIASPKLSEEDINAIKLGYELKDKIIEDIAKTEFYNAIEALNEKNLKILVELIANNVLDIKIVTTKGSGMYHDKLGILSDYFGNNIVFYGSPNESKSAYELNYEKVRVVCSWNEYEKESVEDEITEFDTIWREKNDFIDTYNFKDAAQKSILEVIKSKSEKKEVNPIVLREYQNVAIRNWIKNDYCGFFVMATGTGKTWTAIYAAKELMKIKNPIIVICAPYKHLIKQWSEDLSITFPNSQIIMVSSENPKWENEITESIIRSNYEKDKNIIIVSTIASFTTDRFEQVISKSNNEKLLIVDEAHRFINRKDTLKKQYKYLLGLSATPNNGKNNQKGEELIDFFGGIVFSLPIEEALRNNYLVKYYYYPIYVNATEQEEIDFKRYTANMASCFRNGKCIDSEKLVLNHRNRLRVISMASEKEINIDKIISKIKERDHFIVYCGDGKIYDDFSNEIRHIQFVKRELNKVGFKSSQFTAEENMNTRMQLVDSFNKGDITALAAIRCLDEGINIPSIKSALILSSNDDYKEFVQRRGRILRKYDNKEYANIYDVIVLPSQDMKTFAQIELRRFLEFSQLSKNKEENLESLKCLISEYGLSIDDIEISKDLIQEEHFDE